MPMKGPMDSLASDLASGKIIIEKTNDKKEPEAKVLPEKKRIAMLMKTHDDQVMRHNRAAQEATALSKHHRSRGEHELANICKDMIEPLQKVATLHKKLSATYSKRHGEAK